MKKLFLALLLAGGAVAVQAEEARLLRFPATNGKDVVFTYAGDLYRVPTCEVRRVASPPALGTLYKSPA